MYVWMDGWMDGWMYKDGKGYENTPLKVNFRCLKLYRAYSISFTSSNVCNFLEFDLKDRITVQEKEKKVVFYTFPSSTKRTFRYFQVEVKRRQRKVQKHMMHVQSCYFANVSLLLFSVLVAVAVASAAAWKTGDTIPEFKCIFSDVI